MNRTLAGLAVLTLALGACGGPDAEFELGQPGAATEASGVSQVPLYIPPDYALRPGTAPDTPPRGARPRVGLSSGENQLLAMAGAAEADPRIRVLVDQESSTLAVVDPIRVERLVLGGSPPPPPGLTIERTSSRMVGDPLSLF